MKSVSRPSGDKINSHSAKRPALIRAIGRWSLTAAIINSVIGSGIFGMPSALASLAGAWSPLTVLLAGCSIFIVVLCFAEVGSRFEEGGGPYLYTREAFGPFVGFQIGWLHVWMRLLSGAAVLNVLVAYLVPLVPAAGTADGRAFVMAGAVALVTLVNVRGVRQASWAVNAFTVAKLLPLILLILVGVVHIRKDVLASQVVASPNWTEAVLLLVFAYGGFESAVVAAGETRNPRRDTGFALIVATAVVTAVYCLVQLAIVGILPHAAQSSTPVASALGEIFGRAGTTIGSLAGVLSTYGWLTGFSLLMPRILFSMAERKEMPAFFGRVHPSFRTPHTAIVVSSCIILALGLFSNFAGAATLAAITRLGIFGFTCASLIVFRKRSANSPGFLVPGGPVISLVGIGFSTWLLSTRSFSQAWTLVAIMATGVVFWRFRDGWQESPSARQPRI